MSKQIGSSTEPSIEVLNQVQQSDEIRPNPLMQEIDSLAKAILQIVEKNQTGGRVEDIAFEKFAEKILTYSVKVLYCVNTKTTEEALALSHASSSLLDYFRDAVVPNDCKRDLQKNIVLIQAIAQGVVNDKKDLIELKKTLTFVKELLVITENNKPSRNDSSSIREVSVVTFNSQEYAGYQLLTNRHEILKNLKKLSSVRVLNENFSEDQWNEHLSSLLSFYNEYSEYDSIALIYQLFGTAKKEAPGIFDKLLEVSCKQIQLLNPYYEKGEYSIELSVPTRRDNNSDRNVGPEIVEVETIEDDLDFVTPNKQTISIDDARLDRILDFATPQRSAKEPIARVLDFTTPSKDLEDEVSVILSELSTPILKTEVKEKLAEDWLGEAEDFVMEYRVTQDANTKKIINERLKEFLKALEKGMFIDGYCKSYIQSLLNCDEERFLRKWSKWCSKLFRYADKAKFYGQLSALNKITDKDQKRLEGIVEGFNVILQMSRECKELNQETIQTLKVMMENVVDQFDSTKPREQKFKEWFTKSMALEKFWRRFNVELEKIIEEINQLLPNTKIEEPKLQEPDWADRIEE